MEEEKENKKKVYLILIILLILLIAIAGVFIVFKFVINPKEDALKTGTVVTENENNVNNEANVNEEQVNIENNTETIDNTNNQTNSEVNNNTNNNQASDKNNTISSNTQAGNKNDNTIGSNTQTSDKNNTTSTNKNQTSNNNSTSKNNSSTSNKPATSTTSSGFKSDINKVKLNPMITRYPALDNKIGSAVNSVVRSGMSNYDKLAALYNYVKNKLSYKASGVYWGDVEALVEKYHYSSYDALQLINAKGAMDRGTGVCDDYAALFMVLARRVGFDAYVINGQAPNQNSGRGGHAWVLIRANGRNYFCDPQIEDYNRTKYNLFGKTEAQTKNMYSNYSISSSINSFNYFRAKPAMTTKTTISGGISRNFNQTTYTSNYKQDSGTVKVGDKITVSTSTTNGGGSVKYTVTITEGGKTVASKSGTNNGGKITASYTFKKEGNAEVHTWIRGKNGTTEYTLRLNVKDQNKIEYVSYRTTQYPSGLIKIQFTAVGGTAPYTYKMELLETDAKKGYSIDDSSNDKYITPGDGTYFKVKVTTKDSKGAIFTERLKYDVKKCMLSAY